MKPNLTDIICRSIIIALAIFFIVCLVVCCVSCKPKQQIIERTLTDTVYKARTDTVRLISERLDSVVYRDSVFTIIKGDTVLIKEYHYRDNTKKVDNDTYKARTDTLWQTRTVSEYKTQTVEVERKLRWWQKLLIWIGGICLASGVGYGAYKARKFFMTR